MRMRFKSWARPELLESSFFIDNPKDYKNKWRTAFKNQDNPIHLELGCGKGTFISKLASTHKDINYIAIDMIDSMLGVAGRNIKAEYEEKKTEIDNLIVIRYDIMLINEIIGEKDKIDRIYINFCNPWPRGKHHKKRLTHPKQLELYKIFLNNGAEIHFKTDDDNLFEESQNYFKDEGFNTIKITRDLENEPIFEENIETEHEQMFKAEGIKIKGGIYRYEIL